MERRADLLNVFDDASNGKPVSDISSATFDPTTGRILNPENFGLRLSTNESPGIGQFSLKFGFYTRD